MLAHECSLFRKLLVVKLFPSSHIFWLSEVCKRRRSSFSMASSGSRAVRECRRKYELRGSRLGVLRVRSENERQLAVLKARPLLAILSAFISRGIHAIVARWIILAGVRHGVRFANEWQDSKGRDFNLGGYVISASSFTAAVHLLGTHYS